MRIASSPTTSVGDRILALAFWPARLVLEAVALLVGWSRVELGDHTLAQAIAKGVIGALVAALTSSLLR